jgi:hypothetical protein
MCFNLVFELESSQSLVVKYFTDLPAVKLEVRVGEVAECNASNE